jgi:uncharacterized protein
MSMEARKAVRDAILFSGTTVGLSYLVFWGPIALFGIPTISFVSNVRGPIWAILLYIVGGFVPSLVAVVLTAATEGGKGLKALLRSCLQFKLGFRWYLGIVLVVLVGAAGQILITSLLGNSFKFGLYISQLSSLIPLIVLGPLSEEFGWRGYLLNKLQQRWNALTSSIVVGIVWGLWHLPLFYMVGTSQHELRLPFIGFLVGVIAVSVAMTWVNNNTKGSIWAAIFFHWLYTYTVQVNSSGVTRSFTYNWLEYAPYLLIAIVVVAIWKPKKLSVKGGLEIPTDAG